METFMTRCSVDAVLDCLDAKDHAYREMLSIALTQLHEAEARYAALQARYDVLKEEHRRLLAVTCTP